MTKEQRHLRHEVTKAVETEHAQLQEELANSRKCRDLTKTVTYNYRRQILAVAGQMPEPIFTTKQIMQIEIYAIRQPDLQERQRIESLINHAELRRHVLIPRRLSITSNALHSNSRRTTWSTSAKSNFQITKRYCQRSTIPSHLG